MLKCPHSVIKERQECTGLPSLLPVVHLQSKTSCREQLLPSLAMASSPAKFLPSTQEKKLSFSQTITSKELPIFTLGKTAVTVHTITNKAQNNKTKSWQKVDYSNHYQRQTVSAVKLFIKWHENRY